MHIKKSHLRLELLLAFCGVPLLAYFFRERGLMFFLLWLCAISALITLMRQHPNFSLRREWNSRALKKHLAPVLKRFALMGVLLFLFTVVHDPERLFVFPLERPVTWLMVMFLYPILSVWPQEIVFRTFFMQRYGRLFGNRLNLMSAAAFAFAHILFNNWIAITFCFFGGLMFADTYRKSRSLALVCLEHALYGCLLFTLGLGWYFYGAAWKH